MKKIDLRPPASMVHRLRMLIADNLAKPLIKVLGAELDNPIDAALYPLSWDIYDPINHEFKTD